MQLDSRKHVSGKTGAIHYVVERTFGSQARWFGSKILRYRGKAKAHA